MARPKRFELLTFWFVARYSIQLSYGRIVLAGAVRFELTILISKTSALGL